LSQQLPQSPPQQNYQQAPSGAFSFQAPDPQLMYSDPAAYQNQLLNYQQQVMQQTMQQAAAPLFQGVAENAKWASQQDAKHRDVWSRYGHEIEAQMATIPAHLRTKQMWDTAAKLVKSEHLDELVHERAQTLAAQGGFGTERSTPAGAPQAGGFADPIQELFANADHPEVARMKAENITPQVLRDFLAKTGKDAREYVKDVLGGNTFGAN
jgi:hypothetical protein